MSILNSTELQRQTRSFFDPEKTRNWVFENAKNAFEKKLNTLETDKFKLVVKNLSIPDKKFSLKEQKQALLEKRDLSLPLKGEIQLIDKETGELKQKKKLLLANIPYITERNTTIVNGSEYITINQQRLKPGVYTRIKESGEAEGHVNVLPGSGMGGKLIFYPDTALFVYYVGTTQIKLYGLLKDLGVSDGEIRAAWGTEIFNKNKAAYDGNEVDKFYSKVFNV